LKSKFKAKVVSVLTHREDANDWWIENSKIIKQIGEELLGKTSGKEAPHGKETW
jgi:hypothetical protein